MEDKKTHNLSGKIILFNPLTACEYIRECPEAGSNLRYCLNRGQFRRGKCLGKEIFDSGAKRGLSVKDIMGGIGLEKYEDRLGVLALLSV